MPRTILSATDLSPEETLGLFRRSEDAAGDPMEMGRLLQGRVVAGLFFQPAPRTETALRAACARAGAVFVSGASAVPGPAGEDLLEAAEAAGAYADLLVVRHPLEGAARAAAAVAGIPVLNAGDGAREDPLRALPVLRLLASRRGGRAPRAAALCGDLRNNRLAHSLAAGLSRSEEHTSELQSQSKLVCRLLLEKKKNTRRTIGDSISEVANVQVAEQELPQTAIEL